MPRRIPLVFESLPNAGLEFEAAGALAGFKLLANGNELKKSKGKYTLPRSDGGTAELQVKAGLDFANPKFVHESETVSPMEALPVPLIILSMLPFGLAGVGGAIGGGLGGGAFMVNMGLMRKDLPLVVRIALSLGVTAVAIGIWLAIAAAIRG